MHLEAAIVLQLCCVTCVRVPNDHASPEQNLGIIEVEVSNGEYGKESCLFMIKKKS